MEATYVYRGYFRQICTVKQFAKNTGEEILYFILYRTRHNKLFTSDIFTQPYYEWRILKRDSIKTWNKFQNNFMLTTNNCSNMTTTTRDTGFHSAVDTRRVTFDVATTSTTDTTKSDILAFYGSNYRIVTI